MGGLWRRGRETEIIEMFLAVGAAGDRPVDYYSILALL